MRYGEMGYHLEIDLANGNIEKVETDPGLTELHLGGLGTSVKQHWDRVPPEVTSTKSQPRDFSSRANTTMSSALIPPSIQSVPVTRAPQAIDPGSTARTASKTSSGNRKRFSSEPPYWSLR